MDAVESLLKIHIADVQLPLPFGALSYAVVQSEDLVRASPPLSETCLVLSESMVLCFTDPPNDELG